MREMKDSGIEWIGEIPADWNLKKLKHTFTISSGTTPKSDNLEYWDGDIPWVTPADYKTEDKYVYHGRKFLSEAGLNATNLQLLPVNSIIFSKRAPIGAVAITGAKLAINQGCISCVPAIECDIRYYYFILSIYTEQFNLLGSGTTFKEISSKDFGNFTVPAPSVSVQEKLADYLDRKCSQIDAIIARQQEVIEKLKAYKLSVITEAVTKGLNPNVPMKDSGVEWIGEVPVHWDLIKATRIIISTQNGLSRRDLSKSTGKIVLKLRNISSNGEIDYEYQNRIELTGQELDTYRLSDGDILFVRVNGSKSLVGKCAIFHSIGEDVAYNDHIIRVRISEKCIKKFLFWYLLSICGKMEIDLHTSTSAGQYTISGEELRDIRFILPPKIEQLEIDRYLSKMSRCIDKIIHQKQISIDELSAYKKSLIFEVVTGKREV